MQRWAGHLSQLLDCSCSCDDAVHTRMSRGDAHTYTDCVCGCLKSLARLVSRSVGG